MSTLKTRVEKLKEQVEADLVGMSAEGSQSLLHYFLGYLDSIYDEGRMDPDELLGIRHWLLMTFEEYRASQSQDPFYLDDVPQAHDNPNGYKPLHWAVLFKSTQLIESLLAENRCVDVRDQTRQTPLHLAVLSNHYRHAQSLLLAGANPNARDSRGRRPDQRTLDPAMLKILNKARERNELEALVPALEASKRKRM